MNDEVTPPVEPSKYPKALVNPFPHQEKQGYGVAIGH